MEEQVGMMAHNEAYKQSIEAAASDELYQDTIVPLDAGSKELLQRNATEEPIDRKAFNQLNPASTTSSIAHGIGANERNS